MQLKISSILFPVKKLPLAGNANEGWKVFFLILAFLEKSDI